MLNTPTFMPPPLGAKTDTIAAANGAQYIIQGFRGTRFGTPSDAIIVQFGNDGGSFISGSNAATAIKMAA